MTKEDFYRRDDLDDLSDFEGQLRSITPAPPQTDWWEMAELLKQPQKNRLLSGVSRKRTPSGRPTNRWHRLATHSAATLVGVGIGAVLVLMLRPAGATAPTINNEAFQPAIVSQDWPKSPPRTMSIQQPVDSEALPSTRYRMLSRFEYRNAGASPLTPLSGRIDARTRPRNLKDINAWLPDDSTEASEPIVADQPKSAPELMRELLNGMAHLSSSRR